MILWSGGNVSFRGETSYFRRPTDAVPKGRHPHGRRRQSRRLAPKPRRLCYLCHNVAIRSVITITPFAVFGHRSRFKAFATAPSQSAAPWPDVRRARLYKQQSRRPCEKPTALPSPHACSGYVGRPNPQWVVSSLPGRRRKRITSPADFLWLRTEAAPIATSVVVVRATIGATIDPPRRHPSPPIRHVGFGLILAE
jgi:hypothetical protein